MTRRELFSTLAAPALTRAQNRRPNIVFLLSDDQRWDALGCMGNPIVRTPNIDKLAAGGVTFTNNFVTTSICMCSRASIFSGQYARTHGIWDFAKPFTPEQWRRTYPALFRAAGYRTGFIGKFGVGNKMPAAEYDYWRGFPGQGTYQSAGKPHLTQLMGDQAGEFLSAQKTDTPFCLQISFKAPHVQDEDPRQFIYDPAHASWYKDARIPIPKTADPKYISMLPLSAQRSENRRRWAVRFGTPALYQESVKSYYRLITELDETVGRVMAELSRAGAAENTVVVFASDNGFYLGEHGLAGKWLMHEESIRVPLIVYDPRLPQARRGKRRDEMSLNIDIAPTLLEAAGLQPPPSMQGHSVMPLVRGESPRWRQEFFYEHLFSNQGWIPPTEGVRTQSWKYTRYIAENPLFEEVFDLRADPLEERNLAGAPQGRIDERRRRCDAWLAHLKQFGPGDAWKEPELAT